MLAVILLNRHYILGMTSTPEKQDNTKGQPPQNKTTEKSRRKGNANPPFPPPIQNTKTRIANPPLQKNKLLNNVKILLTES